MNVGYFKVNQTQFQMSFLAIFVKFINIYVYSIIYDICHTLTWITVQNKLQFLNWTKDIQTVIRIISANIFENNFKANSNDMLIICRFVFSFMFSKTA